MRGSAPLPLMATFMTGSLCLALAIPAQGDPPVADPSADYAAAHGAEMCEFITQHPTGAGVIATLRNIVDDSGMSLHDAGVALKDAVTADCPDQLPLLREMMTTTELY